VAALGSRGEHAPDQAILIDMANRRFYFFFIEIWPQEFFFVAGLLVMAGIGLFLVTSVVGRAWCGYTCPQTVWTDLFIAVERFWQGDRNARMRSRRRHGRSKRRASWSPRTSTFLLIAVATGGAWIFYFADAPTLLKDFVTFQAPFVAYSTVAVLTATTYMFRRADARAGVHLHVPVAAHPGGDAGRGFARRHLQ
jgi:cytochrome c oxidase accessory protein FixG